MTFLWLLRVPGALHKDMRVRLKRIPAFVWEQNTSPLLWCSVNIFLHQANWPRQRAAMSGTGLQTQRPDYSNRLYMDCLKIVVLSKGEIFRYKSAAVHCLFL
ncbi:hypothetical protein AVEN_131991-1 [Araneus ventricosus]|uniref:Uncharacterized protein n=1 Tax=Araneus ventricosus TaxID=182803 RepID=A0A4Y2B5C9_ARAVE|nr:hypothetical protein AVEN_131991-1 [Araneus ventricosus]